MQVGQHVRRLLAEHVHALDRVAHQLHVLRAAQVLGPHRQVVGPHLVDRQELLHERIVGELRILVHRRPRADVEAHLDVFAVDLFRGEVLDPLERGLRAARALQDAQAAGHVLLKPAHRPGRQRRHPELVVLSHLRLVEVAVPVVADIHGHPPGAEHLVQVALHLVAGRGRVVLVDQVVDELCAGQRLGRVGQRLGAVATEEPAAEAVENHLHLDVAHRVAGAEHLRVAVVVTVHPQAARGRRPVVGGPVGGRRRHRGVGKELCVVPQHRARQRGIRQPIQLAVDRQHVDRRGVIVLLVEPAVRGVLVDRHDGALACILGEVDLGVGAHHIDVLVGGHRDQDLLVRLGTARRQVHHLQLEVGELRLEALLQVVADPLELGGADAVPEHHLFRDRQCRHQPTPYQRRQRHQANTIT